MNRIGTILLALLAGVLYIAAPFETASAGEESDIGEAFLEGLTNKDRRRIADAADRGAEALLAAQEEDGGWPCVHHSYRLGTNAMITLALVKSGEGPESPAILKAFELMRRMPLENTYGKALLLMAIEAKYAVQATGAGKSRRVPVTSEEDREWARKVLGFLGGGPTWSYVGPHKGDFSNTQYAVLGLRSAMKLGLRVEPDAWVAVTRAFLDNISAEKGPAQKAKIRLPYPDGKGGLTYVVRTVEAVPGGWDYITGASEAMRTPLLNMTLAGVASLSICRDALRKCARLDGALNAEIEKTLYRAYVWLAENQLRPRTVELNPLPGDREGAGYHLYSVERAGTLAGWPQIGDVLWFKRGAQYYLEEQKRDGNFPAYDRSEVLGTAFALLFLNLSTLDAPPGLVKTKINNGNDNGGGENGEDTGPGDDGGTKPTAGKGTVSGVLKIDEVSKKLLAGVRPVVHLVPLGDGDCGAPSETIPQRDGRFAFKGLAAGAYRLIVNSTSGAAHELGAYYLAEVEVGEEGGAVLEIELSLASIKGRVVCAESGEAVRYRGADGGTDGYVILDFAGDDAGCRRGLTYMACVASDGIFSVPLLRAGKYRILAELSCLDIAPAEIDVAAGEGELVLKTKVEPGTLSFKAVVKSGRPVRGVRVALRSEDGGSGRVVHTNRNGVADFGHLSPGEYTFTVEKTGYKVTSTSSTTVVISSGDANIVAVYLKKI